jgi:hypothetical protein
VNLDMLGSFAAAGVELYARQQLPMGADSPGRCRRLNAPSPPPLSPPPLYFVWVITDAI